MANRYSIAGARNNLPALVHAAEAGKAIHLTRRGKPVAVLISASDYQLLTREHDPWLALETFRSGHDLSALEVDGLFNGVRDRSSGRQVKW